MDFDIIGILIWLIFPVGIVISFVTGIKLVSAIAGVLQILIFIIYRLAERRK